MKLLGQLAGRVGRMRQALRRVLLTPPPDPADHGRHTRRRGRGATTAGASAVTFAVATPRSTGHHRLQKQFLAEVITSHSPGASEFSPQSTAAPLRCGSRTRATKSAGRHLLEVMAMPHAALAAAPGLSLRLPLAGRDPSRLRAMPPCRPLRRPGRPQPLLAGRSETSCSPRRRPKSPTISWFHTESAST